MYLTENFLNCRDMAQAGFNESGIFNIPVPEKPKKLQVYCDLETGDGGWLVNLFLVLLRCQLKIKIKRKNQIVEYILMCRITIYVSLRNFSLFILTEK